MADAAHDATSGWVPFANFCAERAAVLPIDNAVARSQEAERLTIHKVRTRELEIRGRDAEGQVIIGVPSGWVWWWWGVRYDSSRGALVNQHPLNELALYRPEVRERQRAKPAESIGPPTTEPTTTQAEPTTESTVAAERSEETSPASKSRDDETLLVQPIEGTAVVERSAEAPPMVESTSGKPTTAEVKPIVEPVDVEQWPWVKNSELRECGGPAVRRARQALEQHCSPEIQHRSIAKIVEELAKAHVVSSESAVRRALGRK